MRKEIFCILLVLVVIISNCSKNDYRKYYEEYTKFTEFPETEKWEFERFCNDPFMLQAYPKTIINNKYLVISDFFNSTTEMIKIYDLDSHKLVKAFGEKGKGPGEFLVSHQVIQHKDKFMVFDNKHQCIYIYKILS